MGTIPFRSGYCLRSWVLPLPVFIHREPLSLSLSWFECIDCNLKTSVLGTSQSYGIYVLVFAHFFVFHSTLLSFITRIRSCHKAFQFSSHLFFSSFSEYTKEKKTLRKISRVHFNSRIFDFTDRFIILDVWHQHSSRFYFYDLEAGKKWITIKKKNLQWSFGKVFLQKKLEIN